MIRAIDALEGLAALEEDSIDLVLSDLPSGATNAPFDTAPPLDRLWPVLWMALKPRCPAVLMASSMRFAHQLIASAPKEFRYDLVWVKNRPTGHLNAKRMPMRAHEFILVFAKSGGSTYHPQKTLGHPPMNTFYTRTSGANYGTSDPSQARGGGATDRYPTSVIQQFPVVTNNKRYHPQQKPVDLMQWLIETYSAPDGLVCDPYAGSASTGIAALRAERRFLGFERDSAIAEVAIQRMKTL